MDENGGVKFGINFSSSFLCIKMQRFESLSLKKC